MSLEHIQNESETPRIRPRDRASTLRSGILNCECPSNKSRMGPRRPASETPRIRDAPPRDSLLSIKNACCGRRCTSAAVDFRLRAQVRSPRFGRRSQPRESNPGPSYRCSRSHGVRPLGQAGPAGSGFCLHSTIFFLALTIQYNRFWAEPFIKRSLALVI